MLHGSTAETNGSVDVASVARCNQRNVASDIYRNWLKIPEVYLRMIAKKEKVGVQNFGVLGNRSTGSICSCREPKDRP